MEDGNGNAVAVKSGWKDIGLRCLGGLLGSALVPLVLALVGIMDQSPVVAAVVCLIAGLGTAFGMAWWVFRKQQRALESANAELKKQKESLIAERDTMREKQDWLEENLERIESDNSIGKFWCRTVSGNCPPLPKLGIDRTTRFIAVVNLKGGVGKTTVSANLAMAIAAKLAFDERILMVDIDFQGTLSDRTIGMNQRSGFLENKNLDHDLLTSTRLIQADPVCPVAFAKLVTKAEDSDRIHVIQAHERLDQAGTLELIRAVTRPNYEVRFRYIDSLHGQNAYPKYRYVIYDCPPRLTTSCINALAAADAFMIPTKLQDDSIDAIGRTLKWVFELQKSQVSKATPLGIVANEVPLFGGKPKKPFGDAFQYLGNRAESWSREYGCDIRVFENLVKHFNGFGALQGGQTAYANLPEAKAVFDVLAEEAMKQMDDLVRRS